MPYELQHSRLRYGDLDEEQERLFNDILSLVEYCLGRLRNDKLKLSSFAESVSNLKVEIDESFPIEYGASSKIETIVDLIGVSQPESVKVYPPTGINIHIHFMNYIQIHIMNNIHSFLMKYKHSYIHLVK